ncbi:MAG TPA: hypothetical protein PKW95_24070 [bacterium]|nr:hypothetical protein [bacterium]
MTASITTTAAALRVATDLRHVRVNDSNDHPQDVIHEGTVYRRLDAPYYAWLRRRMERAKKAHEVGKLAAHTWKTLRQRFNAINTWALQHIGEKNLLAAIESLDEKSYVAPTNNHAIGIVESWDERAAIMEHDGGLDTSAAEISAAHLISRELTPEDVESFKALGVEVHVKSKPGEFTLVPDYTSKDRPEISAEDLRKLSMVMHAFPGSEITYVGPPQGDVRESYTPAPQPDPAPAPAPKPETPKYKPQQPPQQARLF